MRTLFKVVFLTVLTASVCLAGDTSPASGTSASQPAPPGAVFVATLNNGFSIRFNHREERQQISRLYLDAGGSSFVDVPTSQIADFSQEKLPAPQHQLAKAVVVDIPAAVAAASDKHGIDSDLLYSVIRAESDFNPRAVSRKGAQGLMQLMPETAGKLGVDNAFDPAANVEGGTRYLRELLDRYHYNLAKALAAYNAGPEAVDRYHGVPPFHETRVYVAKIIREYNRKKLEERTASSRTAVNSAASNPAGMQ